MTRLVIIIAVLAVVAVLAEARRIYKSDNVELSCGEDKLTVYRLLAQTAWSREDFPKQYPEWRPPAQWSKIVGRSHNREYSLFHLDKRASEGLKLFAEKGQTDVLDAESQGEGGIFDEFNAPPITQGVGETEAEFFMDGNHSRVSFISRVVPSPDWFIGVDSFNLCKDGKWLESVTLEVDPLDAGTDNGFTFTSPNWPTVPQKPVSRITAQRPDHPANSFYYPDRMDNPRIAIFHLLKVKEYELSQSFEPSLPHLFNKYTFSEMSNSLESNDYEVSNDIIPPSTRHLTYPSHHHSTSMPDYDKNSLLNSIVVDYKKKFKKNRKGRKMSTRRSRVPRDCRVNEWTNWSECSKTCGIGEQIRTRTVVKHARRGGRPCPVLQENQWCGSSRDCDHKYFDW
ncbi:unnamed protein product [Meganyctiphanes norvegica]|uniref:Spondin domain-containing protein n=1 Tax=Meganyctiphanes norvegica TaxID=48144 RepID=A0AAV2PUG6_MEGNR